MKTLNCLECGKPGGTIPKYFWVDVSLYHEECAVKDMQRYLSKKETNDTD